MVSLPAGRQALGHAPSIFTYVFSRFNRESATVNGKCIRWSPPQAQNSKLAPEKYGGSNVYVAWMILTMWRLGIVQIRYVPHTGRGWTQNGLAVSAGNPAILIFQSFRGAEAFHLCAARRWQACSQPETLWTGAGGTQPDIPPRWSECWEPWLGDWGPGSCSGRPHASAAPRSPALAPATTGKHGQIDRYT